MLGLWKLQSTHSLHIPVGWGCRIHRLHLFRGVRPTNECPSYDIKLLDGDAIGILELWGIWSASSLPSPFGWGSRLHRLLLCRRVRPPHQRVSWICHKTIKWWGYSMQEVWGMRSIPSLPSLPSQLWPGMVSHDKDPIYGSNWTVLHLNYVRSND